MNIEIMHIYINVGNIYYFLQNSHSRFHHRNITRLVARDLNLFHAQLNFESLIFSGKVLATLSGELGPGCRTTLDEFFLIIKIPVAPGGQN